MKQYKQLLKDLQKLKEEVYNLHRRGLTHSEIAKKLGLTIQVISYYLESYQRGQIARYIDKKHDYQRPLPPHKEEIADIIIHVCKKSNLFFDDIRGDCKNKKLVEARIEIAERLSRLGLSQIAIGKIINKDRTVVLYYLHKGRRVPKVSVKKTKKN